MKKLLLLGFVIFVLFAVSTQASDLNINYLLTPSKNLVKTDFNTGTNATTFSYKNVNVGNYIEGLNVPLYISSNSKDWFSLNVNVSNPINTFSIYSNDYFIASKENAILQIFDLSGFIIYNNTYLSIDEYYTTSGGNNEVTQILFLNSSGGCVFSSVSTNFTSYAGGIFPMEVLCSPTNSSTTLRGLECENRGRAVKNTYNKIEWNLDTCRIGESGEVIKYLGILTYFETSGTPATFIYENITLNNVTNISNNFLPFADVSIVEGNELCFNNTPLQINLSINATDLEGDTIYYGLEQFNYVRAQLFYNEDFLKSNGDLDYYFFYSDNFIFNGSTADIPTDVIATNSCRIFQEGCARIYPYLTKYIDDSGEAVGWLRIHDKVDDFIIKPDDIYLYDILISQRFAITLNDTKFNMIFLDSGYENMFNATFNLTSNGNLTMYYDDTLLFNFAYTESEDIYFTTFINKTNNTIDVYLDSKGTANDRVTINQSTNGWLGVKYQQTEFPTARQYIIKYILTEGYNYDLRPVFSTTKPTSFYVNTTGTRLIDVYITDLPHLYDSYVTYSTSIHITSDCSLRSTQEAIITDPDTQDLFRFGKTFNLILIDLLTSFTGDYVNWKFVFNMIYLIPCLGVAFLVYFITFRNSALANISFWFSVVFGHAFMYFETWLTYTSVIMLVLSFVVYIVSRVGGNSTPQGG